MTLTGAWHPSLARRQHAPPVPRSSWFDLRSGSHHQLPVLGHAGPVPADTNGLFQFEATNAPLFPARFYRWHYP